MATKPLSTAARNALLQLYRLGFLWYDVTKDDESEAAQSLIADGCAVKVNVPLVMTDQRIHSRIEITLRGIDVALQIYKDQQRAIEQLKIPRPDYRGMKPS